MTVCLKAMSGGESPGKFGFSLAILRVAMIQFYDGGGVGLLLLPFDTRAFCYQGSFQTSHSWEAL